MSESAILVDALKKRYPIGQRERYLALRDVLSNALRAPFRKARPAAGGVPAGGRVAARETPQAAQRFDGEFIWALDGVSLEINHGEAVGLIGRNGAGKSTLLKILSRITRPTSGRAEIHGRVGSLLEVGTGFHSELTGRENIYLNGAILGMRKAEIDRKFDEIVAFAEVDKFLDTPVKHYSSGMHVRLAFAVAAHLEPEILLVDEVLAVGDASFQKKCLGKMGEVTRGGRTVVFVSHNMSAILNLCSRAYCLERGQVQLQGESREVVKSYLEGMQARRTGDTLSTAERWGNGRVRFTRVRLEDSTGRALEHALSGEPLVVAMDYESPRAEPLPNCRVSFHVEDLFGQIFFICSTEMISDAPRELAPRGTLRCVIPRLPLSHGRYNLSPFIEVNREIEDWVPNAVPFDVMDGDFFGSGRQYPDGWAGKGVLVPHRWETG